MNDKQLEKMAYEVDDILTKLAIKYEAAPIILASVIVARLMLLNDITMSGIDFRKLLGDVSETEPTNEQMNTEIH